MAVIEVSDLTYVLPNGRVLLEHVSFRVVDGEHAALIGANGTGKTTLLRVVGGDLEPQSGAVAVDGHVAMLRQFVADDEPDLTVRDYLVRLADHAVRSAASALDDAERAVAADADETSHLGYADALAAWGDAGGYDVEALWDACCGIALRRSYDDVRDRPVRTFSGGEQKRLALEALFRSSAEVLLLDEPDNFLDLAGKAWLEDIIVASPKTILLISHDRALLARTAPKLITVEAHGTWTHGGGFATYAEARRARLARIDELGRRHAEERERLTAVMKEFSAAPRSRRSSRRARKRPRRA